jgi:toxin ParE1/3/4
MVRVELSPLARQDLLAIWDCIAGHNETAADQIIDLFDAAFALIAANPTMGEARPDLGEDVRIFTMKNYVAIFRYLENGIHVARIVHGARELEALFLP